MNGRLRVLLVEDNPADVDLIRETLPEAGVTGFEIESVARLSEAVQRLERGGIDLLLIDLTLPDSQGLETLHRLRDAAPHIPAIVLTGLDDQETAVTAVRQGAQDYLVKGQVSGGLLERAARYAIERKRAEQRERLAREVLDRLNRPDAAEEAIRNLLQLVRKYTDFEAVGLRLQEGDDFTYYATTGFPEAFVRAEQNLCERDAAGNLVRDGAGKPVLAGMCGAVICGRTNPTKPFFTDRGSFWTNSTTNLLATTTEQDRLARPRNRCNREGYESVALIPLRSGQDIIGLLQLNDHRPNRFTREMIRFFEGLGASIGIALARKQAEAELRESSELLSLFVHHSPIYAYVKSVTPTESRVLRASDNFRELIGISGPDMAGKTMAELFPAEMAAKMTADDWSVVASGEVLSLDEELNGRSFVTLKFPLAVGDRTLLAGYTIDVTERKRAEDLQRDTLTKLRNTFDGIVRTIMRAVEIRDPYTAGHQRRVANLARAIGAELGLSADQLDAILFAGNIHDIGKIAVPAEILSKPGRLSPMEFSLIKEHPRTGFEMLQPVEFPWPLPEIVLQHHERLDGSGYPDGLKGDAIRLEARVIAVADVVEAMASHRPYRAALGIDVALAEITRQRDTQLDGAAVDACVRLFRDKGYQLPQ